MSATDPSFTITGSSIAAVIDGKTYSIKSGSANFIKVRTAILAEDWDAIPGLCQHGIAIEEFVASWSKDHPAAKFVFKDNVLYYDGDRLPPSLNKAILGWCERGTPEPFFRFWRNANENPSHRSLTQMWDFLAKHDLAIDEDGYIIAKKSVDSGYNSTHTAPNGKKLNYKPGNYVAEQRNKISDDPREACDRGLHVGGSAYVNTFSKRIILVRIHPRDVVSVPYDENSAKMRVCALTSLCDWTTDSLDPCVSLKDLPIPDYVYSNLGKPLPVPVDDTEDDIIVAHVPDIPDVSELVEKFDVETANRDALRAKAKDLEIPGRGHMDANALRDAVRSAIAAKTEEIDAFDVDSANRDALRAKAAELEIPGRGKMLATDLRAAIKETLQGKAVEAATAVPEPSVPQASAEGTFAVSLSFAALDKISDRAKLVESLLATSRDGVRAYAQHVGVTGASKIKGGKAAVITAIADKRFN